MKPNQKALEQGLAKATARATVRQYRGKISSMVKKMSAVILSTIVDYQYLAGFIDGDGCILAQIIRREDTRFKFGIRMSVTVYQKSSRH